MKVSTTRIQGTLVGWAGSVNFTHRMSFPLFLSLEVGEDIPEVNCTTAALSGTNQCSFPFLIMQWRRSGLSALTSGVSILLW